MRRGCVSPTNPATLHIFPNATLSVFASLGKLSNLIASNQSLLLSKQDAEILKKGLHDAKEAATETKKQAEAVQKGNEKLLQEIRKGREDKERAQGAQQAKVDQEARSQMFQVRKFFLT